MRVFIVHAHPEPLSFNGALTAAAREALEAAGHEVRVSDLYAMGFDPVSDRRNFTTVSDRGYYRQQAEEAHAAAVDGFAPDIQAEMDKLFWCDVLILQFPLWWFGMPAILKGWVDRVFASGGKVYGGGRWYDRGLLAGKRAMCSVTIGGPETMYGVDGPNGPVDAILYPIQRGVLAFVGFDVAPPLAVHAPARMSREARGRALLDYRERVLALVPAPNAPMSRAFDQAWGLEEASPDA